jgi:hypothetical protein
MDILTKINLKTVAQHFRDAVFFSALATVALGAAEASFFGTVHVANFAFGVVASLACIGLVALAGANVALIVGEVRS